MDLSKLRTLVAVAEQGAVGRASARRHLSQPAVSRQIQALEASFGIRLLDRVGRGVRLTAAGEDLVRHARDVVAAADLLAARAQALRGGDVGPIRFGATPPMIESVLAGFLPGFRARHPGIEVAIVEDGGEALFERLSAGDVHVAYVPAGDDRFAGKLLYPVHVVAVLAPDHRLARAETIELGELALEPLMLLRQGFGSRRQLETAFADAGLKLRVVYESSTHSTILRLAAARHGVGVVPSALVVPDGTVRVVPVVHGNTPIGHWTMLARDPRRTLSPHAETFAGELADYARSVRPGFAFVERSPRVPRPSQRSNRTGNRFP